MLGLDDTLQLPDGVSLVDGAVEDTARAARFATNAAASVVLEEAGSPLSVAAERLARTWRLPRERARQDVLCFAWELNRLHLANVGAAPFRRGHAWARLAVRRLPSGSVPPVASVRKSVDTGSAMRAAVSVTRGLARRALLIALFVSVLGAHLALLAGSTRLALPLEIAIATGAAFVLHESGHAVALVGVPSALVLTGSRAFVLHPPLSCERRRLVALAGPALPAAAGLAAVSIGVLVGSPALAIAGCPFAAHALAGTMLGADGRVACAT